MGLFKDFCVFVSGVYHFHYAQEIDGTVYLKGRVLTNDHKAYFQSGKKFSVL